MSYCERRLGYKKHFSFGKINASAPCCVLGETGCLPSSWLISAYLLNIAEGSRLVLKTGSRQAKAVVAESIPIAMLVGVHTETVFILLCLMRSVGRTHPNVYPSGVLARLLCQVVFIRSVHILTILFDFC